MACRASWSWEHDLGMDSGLYIQWTGAHMAAVRDDTQRHRWCVKIACLEECHLISMRLANMAACDSVERVVLRESTSKNF